MAEPNPAQRKVEIVEGAAQPSRSRSTRPAIAQTIAARLGPIGQEEAGAEDSIRHLVGIVGRRRNMIASAVVCGTALLILAALLIAPKYTALAQIQIIPPEEAQSDRSSFIDHRAIQTVVDTHLVMLGARDFLRKVLVTSLQGSRRLEAQAVAPALGDAHTPAGDRELDLQLEKFEKRVNVSQLLSSGVIAIRFTSKSPDEAAHVANRIVTLYHEQLRQRKVANLQAEIDRLDQRVADLGRTMDATQIRMHKHLQNLSGKAVPTSASPDGDEDLRDLKQVARANGQLMVDLVRRQNETRRDLEVVGPEVRVLSHASPPVSRSSLHPILFIVPGATLLLIGSCFLAIALEQLDQGLRSTREIASALSVPCISLVPELPECGFAGLQEYLRNEPFAPYSEAIRSIAAALKLASPSRPAEVVLLSCSEPREGKTTLAVSIAQYVASIGQRVLLVDLDVRTRGVLRELRGGAEHGVVDLVLNNASPEAIIQRHPALAFDYLPMTAGPAVDPLSLIANKNLLAIFDAFRAKYDLILVDGPSALGRSEAGPLAALADKVLFVVKWGSTRKLVAQNAVRVLSSHAASGRNAADFMAAVVTQVPLRTHAKYRFGDAVEVIMRHGRRLRLPSEASIALMVDLARYRRSWSRLLDSSSDRISKRLHPFKRNQAGS